MGRKIESMDAEERLTRLEGIVEKLADNQSRLDEALVTLAEAQIESVRQNDLRAKQNDLRAQQLEDRLDKLVSAIGEFIRKTG
jgi:exonuclease VII small subunit